MIILNISMIILAKLIVLIFVGTMIMMTFLFLAVLFA